MLSQQAQRSTVLFIIKVPANLLINSSTHRGILLYIEYQSVCPFVGIRSPHPLPASKCVSSPGTKGEGMGKHGVGDPIRTTRKKAWHSVYSELQQLRTHHA